MSDEVYDGLLSTVPCFSAALLKTDVTHTKRKNGKANPSPGTVKGVFCLVSAVLPLFKQMFWSKRGNSFNFKQMCYCPVGYTQNKNSLSEGCNCYAIMKYVYK